MVFIRLAQWTRRTAARASRKLGVFLPAYQGLGIQVWPVVGVEVPAPDGGVEPQ